MQPGMEAYELPRADPYPDKRIDREVPLRTAQNLSVVIGKRFRWHIAFLDKIVTKSTSDCR